MEDLVKRLKDYPAFQEFLDYIVSEIEKQDTVEGLENLPNEQAGEEAKIRAKTKERLYQILKPFLDFKEKREPTEEEINKAKEKFGL